MALPNRFGRRNVGNFGSMSSRSSSGSRLNSGPNRPGTGHSTLNTGPGTQDTRLSRGDFLRGAGLAAAGVAAAGLGLGGVAKAQMPYIPDTFTEGIYYDFTSPIPGPLLLQIATSVHEKITFMPGTYDLTLIGNFTGYPGLTIMSAPPEAGSSIPLVKELVGIPDANGNLPKLVATAQASGDNPLSTIYVAKPPGTGPLAIKNLEIEHNGWDAIEVWALSNFNLPWQPESECEGLTIDNCIIKANESCLVCIGDMTSGNVSITNSKFFRKGHGNNTGHPDSKESWGGIVIFPNSIDTQHVFGAFNSVSISNNLIENAPGKGPTYYGINVYGVAQTPSTTINISNNSIIGAGQGIALQDATGLATVTGNHHVDWGNPSDASFSIYVVNTRAPNPPISPGSCISNNVSIINPVFESFYFGYLASVGNLDIMENTLSSGVPIAFSLVCDGDGYFVSKNDFKQTTAFLFQADIITTNSEFKNNDYGALLLEAQPAAGMVVEGTGTSFVNENFWGFYPGWDADIGCVFFTPGTEGNVLSALKNGISLSGNVICDQVWNLGLNTIKGYERCLNRSDKVEYVMAKLQARKLELEKHLPK